MNTAGMDEDTHLCLNCHITIVGLENYVTHRKSECPATNIPGKADTYRPQLTDDVATTVTVTTVVASPTQLTAATDTQSSVHGQTATIDSATTEIILYDPRQVAQSEQTNFQGAAAGKSQDGYGIEDFLSSLELQVRDGKEEKPVITEEAKGSDQVIDDRLKTLKITNILNDLDFSSDSDELPSDVDELLDYANAEDDSGYNQRTPRGGKWGPSGKLASGQGKGKKHLHSPGKSGKRSFHYGGKGSKIKSHSKHASQGKWKSGEKSEKNKSDESEEENEPSVKERKIECLDCSKTFIGQNSYDRHLSSNFHKRSINPEPKIKKVKVKQEIECPICEKTFPSKYNFARHLASNYHTRREKGEEPLILDEGIQKLLLKQSPIQCDVCSFYCANMGVMMKHLEGDDHVENCTSLSGPLICVRCKFKVYSNDALLQHFRSPEHETAVKESNLPCIVKEVRYNVQCKVCHRDFHSASRLEEHLQAYHNREPGQRPPKQKGVRYKMPCPFCNKVWKSTFQLNIHIRRCHTNERPFPCKPCGVAFTDHSSLKQHEASKKHITQMIMVGLLTKEDPANEQTDPTVQVSAARNLCEHCDFVGEKYCDVKTHYKTEHPDHVYSCKACGYDTYLLSNMESHRKTLTHKKREKMNTKTGEFDCKVCRRSFGNKASLEIHSVGHNTVATETGLKKVKGEDKSIGIEPRFYAFWQKVTTTMSKSDRVNCIECGKSLVVGNLLAHIRHHSNYFPFQCSRCELRFASTSSLRRHFHNIHLEIKQHLCTHCGERFMRKTYLLNHLLKEHKEIAKVDCPYQCTECDKQFPQKHMLTAHSLSHETFRKFPCDFEGCNQRYKVKSELEIHRRLHTGEKPFVCEFCGFAATSKQKLTRHILVHTQERKYSCSYCSYKAQNSTHLHRHMRIHIGTKPYKCPYCSYECNTHENVRKHILKTKKHRGLACYPCKMCNFGTNFVKEFGEHMVEKHNQQIDPKGVLSTVAGLFIKSEDVKDIPEGGMAHFGRETKHKRSSQFEMESYRVVQEITAEEEQDFLQDTRVEVMTLPQYVQEDGGTDMEAVEVDASALLSLQGSKVEWLTEDGTVILCESGGQLYDKLEVMAVCEAEKMAEGEGVPGGSTAVIHHGSIGEVIVDEYVMDEIKDTQTFQTANSSQNMADSLHSIEEISQNMAQSMHNLEENSQHMAQSMHNLEENSQNMAQSMHNLEENSQNMAQSMHNLEENSQNMAQSMHNIEQTSENMAQSMHNIEQTSENMAESTQSMNEVQMD